MLSEKFKRSSLIGHFPALYTTPTKKILHWKCSHPLCCFQHHYLLFQNFNKFLDFHHPETMISAQSNCLCQVPYELTWASLVTAAKACEAALPRHHYCYTSGQKTKSPCIGGDSQDATSDCCLTTALALPTFIL